jgi:hypothetical protein
MTGAQGFERGVNEHADVADREPGDLGDLLVAEVVLKFELQNFLLPRRKSRDDAEEKSFRFLALDPFVRRGIVAFLSFENLVVEISHALFLSANVEGAIAANREEPLRRRGIGLPALVALQFDKRFLDYIAGSVAIAEDARGVLQEGQLETTQEGVEIVIGWDWFGHAHKLFPSSNAPAAELLGEI